MDNRNILTFSRYSEAQRRYFQLYLSLQVCSIVTGCEISLWYSM